MKMLKLSQIKKIHPFMFVGLSNEYNNPLVDSVISSVVKVTKIDFTRIQSPSRERTIVDARHLFCYFARNQSKLSYESIGNMINRNHASVLHACNKVKHLLEVDRDFKEKVPEINNLILQYERVATN